jgi:hypothetical protein
MALPDTHLGRLDVYGPESYAPTNARPAQLDLNRLERRDAQGLCGCR